jgi:hypothetical protein
MAGMGATVRGRGEPTAGRGRACPRQLCAKSRIQPLARGMAGADALTVRLAIQADNHDFPRERDMPLNDPEHQESVPPLGGDSPAAPGNRFSPEPLSRTAMALLQWSLERHQHRRRVYPGGQLRVCVDGEERWRFDPGLGVSGPCRVPLRASYVEIFGADADGELLLVVFPLPAPASGEAAQVQHLGVTLEGGQTVAMDIALADGTDGAGSAYVIQLAYSASTQ